MGCLSVTAMTLPLGTGDEGQKEEGRHDLLFSGKLYGILTLCTDTGEAEGAGLSPCPATHPPQSKHNQAASSIRRVGSGNSVVAWGSGSSACSSSGVHRGLCGGRARAQPAGGTSMTIEGVHRPMH
jgi:hypothetical protein